MHRILLATVWNTKIQGCFRHFSGVCYVWINLASLTTPAVCVCQPPQPPPRPHHPCTVCVCQPHSHLHHPCTACIVNLRLTRAESKYKCKFENIRWGYPQEIRNNELDFPPFIKKTLHLFWSLWRELTPQLMCGGQRMPNGSQRSSSTSGPGDWTHIVMLCWQAPSSTEPSHQPQIFLMESIHEDACETQE